MSARRNVNGNIDDGSSTDQVGSRFCIGFDYHGLFGRRNIFAMNVSVFVRVKKMEPASRTWKKIIVFYLLTLVFSTIFYVFILSTGLRGGGLYYVTGLMWCPAFAAFATKRLFRESIRDLGW